ncbi:hypothetical protein HOP38_02530 [Vibrio mediterranei]|uniref:hypothetical protein n=1 Tax=Vibrio mediterranei TaxID=689 RepID=UPI00181A0261|nr:hypothetical protein [Vibrio mediterranei]NUW71388.1 hypothetical protein [Vibrio mediterranei]
MADNENNAGQKKAVFETISNKMVKEYFSSNGKVDVFGCVSVAQSLLSLTMQATDESGKLADGSEDALWLASGLLKSAYNDAMNRQ